ncbi:YggS family pyridoxal phosphate-dependent enzyme [Candidatus Micrarchaeota archaeon]|nr:YggS family pyridoxal phosphate-dependent enzyme [Candidatus Micrarchaeota archaeon]
MSAENILRRIPLHVKLVAATKYAKSNAVNALIGQGVKRIGENRVQDALEKFPLLLPCEKHFLGTIQSNKIRKIAEHFDWIQSMESLDHAEKLNRVLNEKAKAMPVLVQVNLGEEKQKHGLPPDVEAVREFLLALKPFKNLDVRGLMAVVSLKGDSRPHFKKAKALFDALKDEFGLEELSMGTSDDFQVAIEEGATMVRLGRILFV